MAQADGHGSNILHPTLARRFTYRFRLQGAFLSLGPSPADRTFQEFRAAFGFSPDSVRAFSLHPIIVFCLFISYRGDVFSLPRPPPRSRLGDLQRLRVGRRLGLIWRATDVRRRAQLLLFSRTLDVALPALCLTGFCQLCLDACGFFRACRVCTDIHPDRFIFRDTSEPVEEHFRMSGPGRVMRSLAVKHAVT